MGLFPKAWAGQRRRQQQDVWHAGNTCPGGAVRALLLIHSIIAAPTQQLHLLQPQGMLLNAASCLYKSFRQTAASGWQKPGLAAKAVLEGAPALEHPSRGLRKRRLGHRWPDLDYPDLNEDSSGWPWAGRGEF